MKKTDKRPEAVEASQMAAEAWEAAASASAKAGFATFGTRDGQLVRVNPDLSVEVVGEHELAAAKARLSGRRSSTRQARIRKAAS